MPYGESTSIEIERIATAIVDAAFKIHVFLGPGLLESVYILCLAHELRKRGFRVQAEVRVPIIYDGVEISDALRIDLLINELVIIEAKAVEKANPVYEAQTQTYLKLTGLHLGFLINFNVVLIKNGIKRVIAKPQTPASRGGAPQT